MEKLCRGSRISPPAGTEEPQKGPVLIGLKLLEIVEYHDKVSYEEVARSVRYKYIQELLDHFWKRWLNELR